MILNDDWIRAAIKDDTVVVELLLRLKHRVETKSQGLPFSWGHKQPRSRSRLTASVSRCDRAVSTRCSPTTPLSWSGGASPSVTADGYEDSSRYNNAARSKATATSGYTSNSASTKRGRKKKSFTELKEEESSLLKERIVLEKEIATKNANFEVMRNTNESLKRMKLGFGSKSHNKPSSTSVELQGTIAGQPHQRIVASEVLIRGTQDDNHSQASESRPNRIESTGESFFMIPDLNMMPSDDGMI
ncbi:hypothetical protein QL285_016807 [Trifolium repens]|nr:hypothetical protein QL285_016807 [Trifolium repens]